MIDKIIQHIDEGKLGMVTVYGNLYLSCMKDIVCHHCPLYSDNSRHCNANGISEQVVPFLKDKYPELFI